MPTVWIALQHLHRPRMPNGKDAIAGFHVNGGTVSGFERTPGGKIKTFDPTGSAATEAYGINDKGAITGLYADSSQVHGTFRPGDRRLIFGLYEPGN